MDSVLKVLEEKPQLKLLSRDKLYQKLKADHPELGIQRKDIDAALSGNVVTQIYRRPRYQDKKLKITAPPFSFQIDIAHLPQFKRANKGISQFFLAVDIVSRKAFAYPMKKGTMTEVLKAYEQFLIDAGEPVNSVAGDAFFDNDAFQTMNQELNINVYTDVAKDDHITKMGDKLGIVDRATRTLKQLIQKWMLAHDTVKWTEFLPKVLDLYNSTPHSSLKNSHTPDEVYDDADYMNGLYKGQRTKNERAFESIKRDLKPGSRVRAMVGKGQFEKEKARFSTEVYTIVRQEGYRFVLEDEKGKELTRLYRPSELLPAKSEESEKVKRAEKRMRKAVKESKVARKLARELD